MALHAVMVSPRCVSLIWVVFLASSVFRCWRWIQPLACVAVWLLRVVLARGVAHAPIARMCENRAWSVNKQRSGTLTTKRPTPGSRLLVVYIPLLLADSADFGFRSSVMGHHEARRLSGARCARMRKRRGPCRFCTISFCELLLGLDNVCSQKSSQALQGHLAKSGLNFEEYLQKLPYAANLFKRSRAFRRAWEQGARSLLDDLVFCHAPRMAPRWPKMAPGWPQDGPEMGPRWPKIAPRWPQDGP